MQCSGYACQEIKDTLGRNEKAPAYQVAYKKVAEKEPEIENSPPASDEVKNKTYTMLFSMLILAESHKKNLLNRGFTEEVIERNGYKSTPVFGFKRITRKLMEAGCKGSVCNGRSVKGRHCQFFSGRIFACVPGVNQYANLAPFLKQMKAMGTEFVYEAYDMDKLIKPVCKGDYNEKCQYCEHYRKDWKHIFIFCEKKERKRKNIQNGCRKLAGICRSLNIEGKTLIKMKCLCSRKYFILYFNY